MKRLIVEYFADEDTAQNDGTVEYFACWADDTDHAREQCDDAYPNCQVSAIFGVIEKFKL